LADTPDCAFCAIARGDDSSTRIVAQGSDWVAFFPLDPATAGHTLVIPRLHVEDLWQVEPSLGAALMIAVIAVGQALGRALAPDGMNLITSAGSAAEQTVFHLHLHVVPRWRDDGFGQIWPKEGVVADVDLDQIADEVRVAYAALAT
jgi:histidine triad (HIT) family protein